MRLDIKKNVVFGMYSGLALLMDVHRPARPNGHGVLFAAGSGWHAPLGWDTAGLKDRESQLQIWVPPLLSIGYTVFAVNHRAAPRFCYPAALEDVQRALRFIRLHAGEYGVDPARLGGLGGSSGAHLVGLAALLGARGAAGASGHGPAAGAGGDAAAPGSTDPVERESASLQCVVLRAPPTDLRRMVKEADAEGKEYVLSFMGREPAGGGSAASGATVFEEASPIAHVSSASPPTLLIHGDADSTVPYSQSLAMEAALRAAGAEVRLLTIPKGVHGPDFGANGNPRPDWPDYPGETVSWFDRHLRGQHGGAGPGA